MSDNPTSADNQQERLDPNWLVGFTDGEGCFSISFVKSGSMKSGYQIFIEFVITQGEKSLEILGHYGAEGIFITEGNKVFITGGLKAGGSFKITDDMFEYG